MTEAQITLELDRMALQSPHRIGNRMAFPQERCPVRADKYNSTPALTVSFLLGWLFVRFPSGFSIDLVRGQLPRPLEVDQWISENRMHKNFIRRMLIQQRAKDETKKKSLLSELSALGVAYGQSPTGFLAAKFHLPSNAELEEFHVHNCGAFSKLRAYLKEIKDNG